MAACLMVVITFIILPMQSAKLIEAVTARDPFGGSFRGSTKRPHLLIIGRVSAATLRHFKEALLVSGYNEPMRISLPSALRSFFAMDARDEGQASAAMYAWLHASDRWGGTRTVRCKGQGGGTRWVGHTHDEQLEVVGECGWEEGTCCGGARAWCAARTGYAVGRTGKRNGEDHGG
jgi:hypothetical protein